MGDQILGLGICSEPDQEKEKSSKSTVPASWCFRTQELRSHLCYEALIKFINEMCFCELNFIVTLMTRTYVMNTQVSSELFRP